MESPSFIEDFLTLTLFVLLYTIGYSTTILISYTIISLYLLMIVNKYLKMKEERLKFLIKEKNI